MLWLALIVSNVLWAIAFFVVVVWDHKKMEELADFAVKSEMLYRKSTDQMVQDFKKAMSERDEQWKEFAETLGTKKVQA